MVLIPKTKYEHLLKLDEKTEQSDQTGGQRDFKKTSDISSNNSDNNSHIATQKTDETISSAVTPPNKEENEAVISTKKPENPRLYVNKPLSKMHFVRKYSREKGVKKKVTQKKVTSKKVTTSSKQQKGAKFMKWINYTI